MITIGIRELRQQAARHLRMVEAGETIQVTDRGRAIALLVPVPVDGPLRSLEVQGRLSAAEGDVLDLGRPLRPAARTPRPSTVLARTRREER